ncbi:glycosyltransferase WbsX-domain-containing protein [Fimicolochytrium jonesii]|uniref:glycosyltransferase WbsX-domain-containing protein n=1 Tax=Fimicolochytrium jonesii TaxID=1396493 RepID=UPI0022FE6FE8|nr:glycosyltransferase WbsX-domain-containing protein [Fimicolochytrium jonesii]KAI8817629.1 glycosyltransferase WbsX-domain-containing protein [Fimicolochytrium jonesii]
MLLGGAIVIYESTSAALSFISRHRPVHKYESHIGVPLPSNHVYNHTAKVSANAGALAAAEWQSGALRELQEATSVSARNIKVLGFVFPQFHPIPENNAFWGPNFTEWVNVRKASKNKFGMEVPQPEWGYYNLLDFDVRKRMGDFLRDKGMYGIVIHHYWFEQRPIMDRFGKQILVDGEPNMPFFFNWANEPWTKRWDGLDRSEVLLPQSYGDEVTWKVHFDYLMPYFLHPKYIKVGGRPVFAIYKASHMRHTLGPMMAKFRQWAVEAGFPPGGIEVMQANWQDDPVDPNVDAVYDFQPHAGGWDAGNKALPAKRHPIHHRGAMVSWDNTPRHLTDGAANMYLGSHPSRWYYELVDLIQSIVADPNPMASENFLFINAVNEWGEGNVLEPTVQQGDAYAQSLKRALQFARETGGLVTARDSEAWLPAVPQRPETCILVRTYRGHEDDQVFTLRGLITSLRRLTNPNWVAVIFPTDMSDTSYWDRLREDFDDERLTFYHPPDKVRRVYSTKDAGYHATDYVLKNLERACPRCASAKWLLVTNGDNIYRPDTLSYFDHQHDFIGLNFFSRWVVHNNDQKHKVLWSDRCERFQQEDHCFRPSPAVGKIDLGAMILNLTKFRKTGYTWSSFTGKHPLAQDGKMAEKLISNGFRFANVPEHVKGCQLLHNPSYAACRGMGHVWFDSPKFSEATCLKGSDVHALFDKRGEGALDADYLLANGHCIRYSKKRYQELTLP